MGDLTITETDFVIGLLAVCAFLIAMLLIYDHTERLP